MFSTVLIANRGEIAVRVIRTFRRLGIAAVAVFTAADDGARHVREADRAVEVPSYLDVDAIVAAADDTGAEAIHPGYGFLSESPALARACTAAGIVWIGPDVRALELMGDKIASKEHVAALGVPVVPGLTESPTLPGSPAPSREFSSESAPVPNTTPWSAAVVEAEVGYPLIVKPSAGGGGKGMQVVRSAAELPGALAAARRVAAAAFGDDTLLVERLVTRPRHIEAQVLGDTHGTVRFLGLRECSLQRRHQKVIEEAPAPYPVVPSRELIAAAAVQIARSVDYLGAGTVEFLVSGEDPNSWYFLEMNTRLQVEHPVTEEVTGIDLVEQQLLVAAGEPLALPEIVREGGHAAEARVYAERPERGFLPSTGALLQVIEPDGVRVDSGVRTGQRVSADYDPMLMKVIARGDTRAEALQRLDEALAHTIVLGVHTNIGYLRTVLAAAEVRDGTADTTFLDAFEPPPADPDEQVLAAAAFALGSRPDGDRSPWAARTGWRLGEHRPPTVTLMLGDDALLTPIPGEMPAGVSTAVDGDIAWVWRAGQIVALRRRSRAEAVEQSRRARAGQTPDPELRTPMPGTIVSLPLPDGAEVEAGAVVAVVEAMKMEHPVVAPGPGILDLAVRQGETVAADQVLATIHTHEGSGPVSPRWGAAPDPTHTDDPQDQGEQ